jgi:hypothetical protein
VDALVDEYYRLLFGRAQRPMRRLQDKFDANLPLTPEHLLAMYSDLRRAHKMAGTSIVRSRVVDVMSYLHYVKLFRDLALVRDRDRERTNAYYQQLYELMHYVARMRTREMVHAYGLDRHLLARFAYQDGRLDMVGWNHRSEHLKKFRRQPIWATPGFPIRNSNQDMDDPAVTSTQYSDAEILEFVDADMEELKGQLDDHRAIYIPLMEWVSVPGGVRAHGAQEGTISLRGKAYGKIASDGSPRARFQAVSPNGVSTISVSHDDPAINSRARWNRSFNRVSKVDVSPPDGLKDLNLVLGGNATTYDMTVQGDVKLVVPPDTPAVLEACWAHPLNVKGGSPLYFYVPRGNRQLVFSCDGRLQILVPGEKLPRRFGPDGQGPEAGLKRFAFEVPAGAAGKVWALLHASGKFALHNVPPYLSLHRYKMIVPVDVARGDELSTGWHIKAGGE